MILRYRRRNPTLGLIKLWARLTKNGYTRRPESLYRVLRRLGKCRKKGMRKYVLNPCEPMSHPGERIQIDVKVECVLPDNGFEFTNRFSTGKRDIPSRPLGWLSLRSFLRGYFAVQFV